MCAILLHPKGGTLGNHFAEWFPTDGKSARIHERAENKFFNASFVPLS